MNIQLKNTEQTQSYIAKLREIRCEDKLEIKTADYGVFTCVEFDSSYRSCLSAIIQENRYNSGNYELVIFRVDNHEKEVRIPMKEIDVIYSI